MIQTPVRFEGNVLEDSRMGLILTRPHGELIVKNNKSSKVNHPLLCRKGPSDTIEPFKLTIDGNRWGSKFDNLKEQSNIILGNFGEKATIDYRDGAISSKAAAFLYLKSVSVLDHKAVPNGRVLMKGFRPGRNSEIQRFHVNTQGQYIFILPAGKYAFKAEGNILWQEVIVENGKLTELIINAP